MGLRWLAILVAPLLLLSGCHSGAASKAPTARAPTPAAKFCADVAGVWDPGARRCTVKRDGSRGTHVEVNISYPTDLVGDPTAGPGLQTFLSNFVADFGTIDEMRGTGNASLKYSVYNHAPATKSVVFRAAWNFASMPHPVEGIRTLTFDLARHKQLELTDLFCPGVEPLKAIPPLARPEVEQQLVHTPFTVAEFEPGGSFADDYQAWAVDGDNLVLYLPAGRGPGGVPPGFIQPRIAYSKISPILRERGCAA